MSSEKYTHVESYKYPFEGMIFEGGGSLGVAHVGGLQVFKELGILKNVKYFVGSSAGAIIAGALGCGADPMMLYDILFETNFNDFKDDSFGVVRDMNRFINHFGWYKGDALESWYGDALDKICGNRMITFKEAYERFGTYLVITVTDVNLGKTIYLSHENNPDMMIKRAVRRSSIMPLLFRADHEQMMTNIFKDDDVHQEMVRHYFTDGGLLNNYPIKELDGLLRHDHVVGFRLMSTLQLADVRIPDLQHTPDPPKNVIEYIHLLYSMLRNQALKIHVDDKDWKRTVKIDVKNMSSTDFGINNVDKKFLIDQGRKAAKEFIKDFLKERGLDIGSKDKLPEFSESGLEINLADIECNLKSKSRRRRSMKTVTELTSRRSSQPTASGRSSQPGSRRSSQSNESRSIRSKRRSLTNT